MADNLPQRCLDCLVRDGSLCGSLHDHELVGLSQIGRRRKFADGDAVIWEGDENALCANIVSGAIKLLKTTADGREQAVGLLGKGDFVGQPFSRASDISAVALGDTDLCIFPRSAFERVMDDQPKLERALLERTMKSLNEARERQLTLARKSAGARVASFLLDLVALEDDLELHLPMSRGDMADYLGLTIETVSRQFTELKSKGIIEAARGGRAVTILDLQSLQSLSKD